MSPSRVGLSIGGNPLDKLGKSLYNVLSKADLALSAKPMPYVWLASRITAASVS